MSRRKFTSKFKIKVVLEALKEQSTKGELAKKYKLAPQQIGQRRRDFLNGAESILNGYKEPEQEKLI